MKLLKNISKVGYIAILSALVTSTVTAQRTGRMDRPQGTQRSFSQRQEFNRPQSSTTFPRPSIRPGLTSPSQPSRPVVRPARPDFNSPTRSGRPNVPAANFNPRPSAPGNYHPQISRRPNVPITAYRGNNNRYNNYSRRPVTRFYYSGAYHSRPYYYRPYRAPRFGIRINILPAGYYPFYFGPSRYFYNDGLFYQPYGSYYETIAPPLGAQVPSLPGGATLVVINNETYYEFQGTYYQRTYSGPGNYEVVGVNGYLKTDLSPTSDEGDIISDESISSSGAALPLTTLPENFKTVTLNNITYYVSPSGEYYTKNIDESGKITYVEAAIEAIK